MRDDELLQAARDREYLAACEAAGIKPDVPEYEIGGAVQDHRRPDRGDEARTSKEDCAEVDRQAHGARRNRRAFVPARTEAPELERSPAHEAGEALIAALLPAWGYTRRVAETAGIRLLCLQWMLGRGDTAPMSLTQLAIRLGVTRASLSWHVRRIEDATGLHGRAQKSVAAQAAMREGRRRYIASVTPEVLRQNRKSRAKKAAEAAAMAKAAASGPAGKKLAA